MGGRGSGKTRAGAEWVRFQALLGKARRIALVGPTLSDVREVMIDGPSGLRTICHRGHMPLPTYSPSRRRLEFASGAVAYAFSAEDPDSLRGPQFDAAWCDELAAWKNGEAVWDMLQMGLRLGDNPRCVATTTPRPWPLIKRLVADARTTVSHSTTLDNSENLSAAFIDEVTRLYSGTHLGRQELEGELVEDVKGALWTRSLLEKTRLAEPPPLDHIVVSVDPPASSGKRADACGIIAAGAGWQGGERRGYVLSDASGGGLSPLDWAGRAVSLAEWVGASDIIVEANQGGEMTRHALLTAGCRTPIRLVHAAVNKRARATPVAALYEAGRVSHVGGFPALEDEMCSFGAAGFTGSPDRLDAAVWALWSLLLDGKDPARVRRV